MATSLQRKINWWGMASVALTAVAYSVEAPVLGLGALTFAIVGTRRGSWWWSVAVLVPAWSHWLPLSMCEPRGRGAATGRSAGGDAAVRIERAGRYGN